MNGLAEWRRCPAANYCWRRVLFCHDAGMSVRDCLHLRDYDSRLMEPHTQLAHSPTNGRTNSQLVSSRRSLESDRSMPDDRLNRKIRAGLSFPQARFALPRLSTQLQDHATSGPATCCLSPLIGLARVLAAKRRVFVGDPKRSLRFCGPKGSESATKVYPGWRSSLLS